MDVTGQMAALSGHTSLSVYHSLDCLRSEKVKSGAGSIPSLPRVLFANLLVGSAREQLNEES